MFVGILISAFVILYPIYARIWVREAEASHAEEVAESFLKIQTKILDMSENESTSVNVQMSPEIPFFILPHGMAGVLSCTPKSDDQFGTLELKTRSYRYPNQTYVFEGGGIILEQFGASFMRSDPGMIIAWDAGGDNIRVEVRYIWIENRVFTYATKEPATIRVSCLSSYYSVTPDGPNRENVVIDLTGNVGYENAWRGYLKDVKDKLNEKGYNASVDNLKLTILGKVTTSGVNDIYYYEKVSKIEVRIG